MTTLSLPPALAPLTTQWRWTCWKWVEVKNGKRNKERFQGSKPLWHATTKKPATWHALDICLKPQTTADVAGIMFALGKAQGSYSDIGAIDSDDCRNKATGVLHPWAAALVNRARTYCEVT